jgi:hypothetical protein
VTTGALQETPSVDRLVTSELNSSGPSWRARIEINHTPRAASYATAGSLARVDAPGITPDDHVDPPSRDVAQPMPDAPPVRVRPT